MYRRRAQRNRPRRALRRRGVLRRRAKSARSARALHKNPINKLVSLRTRAHGATDARARRDWRGAERCRRIAAARARRPNRRGWTSRGTGASDATATPLPWRGRGAAAAATRILRGRGRVRVATEGPSVGRTTSRTIGGSGGWDRRRHLQHLLLLHRTARAAPRWRAAQGERGARARGRGPRPGRLQRSRQAVEARAQGRGGRPGVPRGPRRRHAERSSAAAQRPAPAHARHAALVPRGYVSDKSRRRRGCRVDIPRRRVAAAPRLRRGYSAKASRAAAAGATWTFRGDAAGTSPSASRNIIKAT